MASSYLFSLSPTFTQGLVLGQLSILVLLVLILKYLFLDSSEHPFETSSYHPRANSEHAVRKPKIVPTPIQPVQGGDAETTEWFNVLLQQIVEIYRSKLRDDLLGVSGDEVARRRIEEYANKIRPVGFLDYIKVHSVDLGISAPRLFNARTKPDTTHDKLLSDIEFDASYTESVSVSLSTAYLFNYPMPSFARLPVSLTITLSSFKSSILITPPIPGSHAPVLTFTIPPDFTLDLLTTSLMGSRAKLADVPKLHELLQHQVRRMLATRGTWSVVLPGLGSTVAEATKEVHEEQQMLAEKAGFAPDP